MMRRLSRREFLRIAALATGGTVLGACSSPEVTESPAPTKTEKATQAPEPTTVPEAKAPMEVRCHVRTHQEEYFQSQADAFMESQDGVKVSLELTPHPEYEQQLTTLLAGGELGDSYWTAPFIAHYPFVARGVAMDVKPLAEGAGVNLDDYFPSIIDQLTWQGKLVGWPLGGHPGWTSMYTNLDAWEEAGLDTPTWEWTADKQWLDSVKAATTDGRFGYFFDMSAQATYMFIKSWGGDWIDPNDRTVSMINSDATKAALLFTHDLVFKEAVSPDPEAVVENMWPNGLATSYGFGVWFIGRANEIVTEFDWQAFPMPAGPDGKRGTFLGVDAMCINSKSEVAEGAFAWHTWLTSKAAGLAQVDKGLPPPSLKEAWEDPKLADNVNMEPARKWLEVAEPTTYPANGRVNEFVGAIKAGLQGFYLAKDDPVSAIEEMHAAVQEVLDKPEL